MNPTPLLTLHQISQRFGDVVALRDVTLELPPGRIGLLGPNGAGKSTLLKILMGLLHPTTGHGTVLGQPLDAPRTWERRRSIGFMPEADGLVPGLKGVEYVALAGELNGMPRRQAQRRAHEVLSSLGLEEARYRRVEEYSLGMKQRAKLAQALVHDPPVLLLDEPTSGLDPAGREAMLRLLEELGRDHGKSLLLCTHLLGDVERVCERVVILADGEVRTQGPVQDLCARRQDRYRLQMVGDWNGFLDDLRLEGVRILHNNGRGELRVETPRGFATRGFFVLAEHHGLTVRGLCRDDETLEELFHRLVPGEREASAP